VRKKLQRFQDNARCKYIVEPGKANYQTIQGQWHTQYFHNQHAIVLELGCGRGEYTVGLAQHFPNKNFIGIDVKGARLWVGSRLATAHQLTNVAFLRAHIAQLDQFFVPGEVAELYLPFPDPHPRDSDAKRRLTSPRFLAVYRSLLQPGGTVHLKTDNEALFGYTLTVLQSQSDVHDLVYTTDLYQSAWLAAHHGIQTRYEQTYLSQGVKIKYLRFALGRPT
jgi:tRNA (guanine-N7-)-methyltransferase